MTDKVLPGSRGGGFLSLAGFSSATEVGLAQELGTNQVLDVPWLSSALEDAGVGLSQKVFQCRGFLIFQTH